MSPPAALPAHLLHLITLHTLSNEGFHASHSTASIALADVLGRYIQLIASTAGDYAATTGRTTVGLMDAVEALDELGVRLDDLDDFAAEARGRGHIGDTKQLRDYLDQGRDVDTSDHRTCVYQDVPDDLLSQLFEQEYQSSSPDHLYPAGIKAESEGEEDDSFGSEAGPPSEPVSPSTSSVAITEISPGVETPKPFNPIWKESHVDSKATATPRRMGKGVDRGDGAGLPSGEEDDDRELEDDNLRFGRITSYLPPLPDMHNNAILPPTVDIAAPPPGSPKSPRATSSGPEGRATSVHPSDPVRPTSTSAQPSYFLPTPYVPDSDAPPLLPPSSSLPATLLPPLPNPHTPSASTIPQLLATHASLSQAALQPTYFSRGNLKRFRAAWNLSSRATNHYTASNSLFGAIPVPPPRHAHIVPSQPTDPTVPLLPRTMPVAGLPHPSGAIEPATAHRYPSSLSTALTSMAPPSLLARTVRMGQPGVLVDERGQECFYGGVASVNGIVEGPPERKPGEEEWDEAIWGPDERHEKGKLVAKEVQVEVRATWDTPVRNWADPELPLEKRRRI